MNKRVIIALIVCGAVPLLGTASCGDTTGVGPDGSLDGTLDNNLPPGDGGSDSPFNSDAPLATDASDASIDAPGCWSNCTTDGGPIACSNLGVACTSASDCCSGNCTGGSCQPPQCIPDNGACTKATNCCSGMCSSGGTCTPLSTTCKTLGNPCASGSDCCSTFCLSGICSQPSYCGQNGDTCHTGADCCGGLCTIAQGQTVGTCTQPAQGGSNCSMVDGVVCGPATTADGGISYAADAGSPTCGGSCCSRDCAPFGPTGVLICQPASGCRPVGDVCFKTSDCCGGSLPPTTQGYTVCNGADPDAGVPGTCGNSYGCDPNGSVCKLSTKSCSSSSNCCSGNTSNGKQITCSQDDLGVPRCTYLGDGGACVPSSGSCATSADCCNLNPCVPDPNGGGLTCYPSACVPTTGPCTTSADCCVGGTCYIPSGQTTGSCQSLTPPPPPDAGIDASTDAAPDAPPPCALYGQTCTVDSDCCNGVPCLNGRCTYPVF